MAARCVSCRATRKRSDGVRASRRPGLPSDHLPGPQAAPQGQRRVLPAHSPGVRSSRAVRKRQKRARHRPGPRHRGPLDRLPDEATLMDFFVVRHEVSGWESDEYATSVALEFHSRGVVDWASMAFTAFDVAAHPELVQGKEGGEVLLGLDDDAPITVRADVEIFRGALGDVHIEAVELSSAALADRQARPRPGDGWTPTGRRA